MAQAWRSVHNPARATAAMAEAAATMTSQRLTVPPVSLCNRTGPISHFIREFRSRCTDPPGVHEGRRLSEDAVEAQPVLAEGGAVGIVIDIRATDDSIP